jgi:hypothetical protein
MAFTLSGIVGVIEEFAFSEELIAREGIAIMVTMIAIVKTDTAIAKIFFMTKDFNECYKRFSSDKDKKNNLSPHRDIVNAKRFWTLVQKISL